MGGSTHQEDSEPGPGNMSDKYQDLLQASGSGLACELRGPNRTILGSST